MGEDTGEGVQTLSITFLLSITPIHFLYRFLHICVLIYNILIFGCISHEYTSHFISIDYFRIFSLKRKQPKATKLNSEISLP